MKRGRPGHYREPDPTDTQTRLGGWLYAAYEDMAPLVKIGCTRKPVRDRLQLLTYEYKTSFTLAGAVYVSTHHIYKVERLVHLILAAQRIQGEWFYLHVTQKILEQVVEQAIDALQTMGWEKKRHNVNADVLKGLAQALGCTTDYLVGMNEDEGEKA